MSSTTQTSAPGFSKDATDSAAPAVIHLLRRALQLVLSISLLGATFSGVLTYRDYTVDAQQCSPLGPSGSVFGYPPCVYGLVMYSIILVIAGGVLLRTRGYDD